MIRDKKVLVTGGTGLIGRQLVKLLIDQGAAVRVVALDDKYGDMEFEQMDLTIFENCLKVCKDMDYVFHLAGVKGSPMMTKQRPASFFVPMLRFNTNMMEAARQSDVERYLFTSTIGVYHPAEVFYEDDMWTGFPSKNDWFAGWAKRMGELQAEAYKIQYGWNRVVIVRPANVYGPYDIFDSDNAMVIPSLIKRAVDGENPLVVWGDGSPIRDFIHAEDVARGMILAIEKGICQTINLGSGTGTSIKEIVEIIVDNLEVKPEVVWDKSKPLGDKKRLMDITRAQGIGFKPRIPIEKGIKEVMDWYKSFLYC